MDSVSRNNRHFTHRLTIAGVAVLILLAAIVIHHRFTRRMIALVSDQFNQEQIAIARSVRKLVENSLNALEKELLQIAEQNATPIVEPERLQARLQHELERMTTSGIAQIRVWDRMAGRAWIFSRGGYVEESSPVPLHANADALPETGEIRMARPPSGGTLLDMVMMTPLGPGKQRFIFFRVNLAWLLAPLVNDIRSGISGYVWIIDDQGRFLYHPYTDFIGRSAFDVRKATYPELNFVQIDRIQKEEMLAGREGTGSYQSGWHRGITGPVDKLIAFCPIYISTTPRRFWSVAVVAPTQEIAGAVGQIHRWELVSLGLMLLVVVVAAAALIGIQLRFSRRLEKLVAARTQALKRSEEKYRLLIESAEDFIFTLDDKARLNAVNSYTAHFFGSDADDLIGRSLADLLSEDVARRNIKAVKQVYATRRSVREEIEIRSVDPAVWLNANYMPLKNEAGEITTVLCIARDITESKTLQHRLVTTEKLAALGTLAAGVAHEINNPLGVILGFCDLLVRKQPPESQAYQDLKIIERQGLHCKEIVDNLLSFARDRKISEESTDLNQCLEEIIKVARHSIERQGVTVTVSIARGMPPVCGDCRQLQQVFLNLMNNAVGAMPDGGELAIDAFFEKPSRHAAVKVSDTGCGIPEADMDRIYEPFFTTKPEGQGTGLGLFVSYGIISSFGGSLQCQSRVAGKSGERSGTTFIVKLPQRS
ncbi:sensor histidine kinase [Desulfosarcina ovata subsp. sediminis]|uniref:histidine kinase n=1 Tax=Desulfosarcina ovata subsp. sediminis TaxID=885957 RepID=A0A5K7ZV40_9BACT|nr:sensor histidine kinase [Desulfosarcina ovata]BBO84068.1 sensor histidine kinase [Desulfosarcina ovata subsp. sediminis]